jgi:lipopolysaccharide cholinephosphotransferase
MITDTLQNELRERYNPDGSTLRKQQLRMLEMLQYIDFVCKKHNIKYC